MTTSDGGGQTEPEVDAEAEAEHLLEVRRRRAELLESMNALEQALAAPVPGGPIRWVQNVSAALLELSGDFRDHVEITEGPSGLYTRVNRSSPRLSHQVQTLIQDPIFDLSLVEPDVLASPLEPDRFLETGFNTGWYTGILSSDILAWVLGVAIILFGGWWLVTGDWKLRAGGFLQGRC